MTMHKFRREVEHKLRWQWRRNFGPLGQAFHLAGLFWSLCLGQNELQVGLSPGRSVTGGLMKDGNSLQFGKRNIESNALLYPCQPWHRFVR